MPLSTLSGWADWPTFSPDARQVAFSRVLEYSHHHDTPAQKSSVYVQLVGSAETRQLTTIDTDDFAPELVSRWPAHCFSPQDRDARPDSPHRPLGGTAMKVSDFTAQAPIVVSRWPIPGGPTRSGRHR